MKYSFGISTVLLLVASCCAFACDEPRDGSEARTPKVQAAPPQKADPPIEKKEWFEGTFRGALELSPEPSAAARDQAERGGSEPPQPEASPRKLSLEVSIEPGNLTGKGTFDEERIEVAGTLDEQSLRLRLVGEKTRGVWVGSRTGNDEAFSGVLRVASTRSEGPKTKVQPYLGELVLTKEK